MLYDTTPHYPLNKAVEETGMSADALRAWERRYGLPMPHRTAGGHRLYSQRDIAIVKWLRARQKEGMRISQAVGLWKKLNKNNRDPLATEQMRANAPTDALAHQRQAWINACLRFDERQANQVLSLTFATHRPEIVCTEILMRGLGEIGNLWHRNQASVQQEHFASRLVLRRIESLIAAAPPVVHPETILLACPPEEEHVLPLLFLEFFLRRNGWHTVNLGNNVPLEHLSDTLESIRPTIVVLSAQTLYTAAHLKEMAKMIYIRGIPLAYGGRIFILAPQIRPAISGHYLGSTLEHDAMNTITQLVETRQMPRPAQPLPHEMQQALQKFQTRRLLVETTLLKNLPSKGIADQHVHTANQFLGDAIWAALMLGDLEFMRLELHWLVTLLQDRSLSPHLLYTYLNNYVESLSHALPKSHHLITTWLHAYLAAMAHNNSSL